MTGPALITWTPTLQLWQGDCLTVLRSLPDSSVHSVVTDPPYGLSDHTPDEVVAALTAWAQGDRERVPDGKGFMGRSWDRFVPPPAVWDECLRVLKPGGYMAVFAGSRTADLMGLSIRLAGFEIRDTITWMYGSGFPKSLDIGKAIDKAAGAAREVLGESPYNARRPNEGKTGNGTYSQGGYKAYLTEPSTEAAKKWDGWGTALKPASEPIIVARKPFPGTVASNVLTHSTAGINVDACRVHVPDRKNYEAKCASVIGLDSNRNGAAYGDWSGVREDSSSQLGRWPANIVLSHASTPDGFDACADGCVEGCPVAVLDAQSGSRTYGVATNRNRGDRKPSTVPYVSSHVVPVDVGYGGYGGASSFFNVFRYQAKAPKSERPVINGKAHPTVKPLALMRWLAVLFTPPGGTVLDPFTGSGTTGEAAQLDGFEAILIDDDPASIAWTQQRLRKAG